MNATFETFRNVQAAQEKAQTKAKLLQGMGQAIEASIRGGLDAMDLRHPEICDKMLELHLLLMFETNPSLEPKKPEEPPPVE